MPCRTRLYTELPREAGNIERGVRQDRPILVNEADTFVFRLEAVQIWRGRHASVL